MSITASSAIIAGNGDPALQRRSPARYVALLFALCIPVWVIGALVDVELFPGFKLFQAGLAMPMIAALILVFREQRWAGIGALLRRTYDVRRIKPRRWFVVLVVYLWGPQTLARFRFARVQVVGFGSSGRISRHG